MKTKKEFDSRQRIHPTLESSKVSEILSPDRDETVTALAQKASRLVSSLSSSTHMFAHTYPSVFEPHSLTQAIIELNSTSLSLYKQKNYLNNLFEASESFAPKTPYSAKHLDAQSEEYRLIAEAHRNQRALAGVIVFALLVLSAMPYSWENTNAEIASRVLVIALSLLPLTFVYHRGVTQKDATLRANTTATLSEFLYADLEREHLQEIYLDCSASLDALKQLELEHKEFRPSDEEANLTYLLSEINELELLTETLRTKLEDSTQKMKSAPSRLAIQDDGEVIMPEEDQIITQTVSLEQLFQANKTNQND